jgi:hypothetical protein
MAVKLITWQLQAGHNPVDHEAEVVLVQADREA